MRSSRSIYVGNLPLDIKESEIEDLFYKYGRIVDIELKIPPRPPGYCFVEFEDSRDAEDAIRGRDGYNFDGCHLRVELAHGGRGQSSSFDRRGGYGSGGGGAAAASRRSEYRVVVRGLPASASWQDLKDHMRKAGDVCFAQVFRKGDGKFFCTNSIPFPRPQCDNSRVLSVLLPQFHLSFSFLLLHPWTKFVLVDIFSC
ncbi:hypothetical protein MKW98_014764 [Papaver atlanticum]|uniref:RRM domain-containing protein n=1 Tax=Papaver atlanticum TaxID=357466 RepID=A0AAD4SF20_9MAGN|nr:hypothetical protein MKW98_014764 [Papaver atlanticum]